jgi:hypothetical protein
MPPVRAVTSLTGRRSRPDACTTSPIPRRTPARADQDEPSRHRPELAKLPELAGDLAGGKYPLPEPPLAAYKRGQRLPRPPHFTTATSFPLLRH